MNNLFEIVKRDVKIYDVINHFVAEPNSQGKVICPFHMEKTPSLSINTDTNSWKCFGCGKGGDAIDFVCELKGISNIQAAEMLAEMYGISYEKNAGSKIAKQKASIKKYIENCKENVGMTDYFEKRGLSKKTISKFQLGYDREKRSVVIPYSSKLSYYQTRSTVDKKFFKPKTEDAGAEPLWGMEAMSQYTKPIFVVESPICAMSIMQCGGVAVSICGASNIRKLLDNIKKPKEYAGFILCLDNDEPGKKASMELATMLYEKGAKYLAVNIADKCKDPNELLVLRAEQLVLNVIGAVRELKKKYSSLQSFFTAKELSVKEIPDIKWIVKGLLPEGLGIFCAPSKFGKSWMMMQLCLAVSQGKPFLDRDTVQGECVYMSLEDNERRFKDRLLKCVRGGEVPDGFYGMTVAKRIDDGLFTQLAEIMDLYPKVSLIVIDILQKVRGVGSKIETAYSADYREFTALKDFAEMHNISIFVIHHLRKMVDDQDVFNNINGSTGLMGSSDFTWILSRKKRDDVSTKLSATGRDIVNSQTSLIFDESNYEWRVLGDAADEAYRLAKQEYESHPVIKTIKALVKQYPTGWTGNCTELKVKIYEVTGELYFESVENIGKIINKYLDRLYADRVEHKLERGKKHTFRARVDKIYDYIPYTN